MVGGFDLPPGQSPQKAEQVTLADYDFILDINLLGGRRVGNVSRGTRTWERCALGVVSEDSLRPHRARELTFQRCGDPIRFMDPVTQTVLGASIGAAMRPRLGTGAVVLGGICGAVPDLDMVMLLAGPWAMLEYHRAATHSLLVLTAAAPAFAWLGYRFTARKDFLGWTCLAWLALVTHTLLDWCTSYGTLLWWPLTQRRYAIDSVSVIDPLYTLPLLAATIYALWPRVSDARAARLARIMLVLTTCYLGLGYLQSRRAAAISKSKLTNFDAVEIRAMPTLFNNGLWRAVAHVSTWVPAPVTFDRLPRLDDPLVDRALNSERGKLFCWFAMDLVSAEVDRRDPSGAIVTLSDQRYGLITRPLASPFRARATFDADGQLVSVERLPRDQDPDIPTELRALARWVGGTPPLSPGLYSFSLAASVLLLAVLAQSAPGARSVAAARRSLTSGSHTSHTRRSPLLAYSTEVSVGRLPGRDRQATSPWTGLTDSRTRQV